MWNSIRKALPLAMLMFSLSSPLMAGPRGGHGGHDGMPMNPAMVERMAAELKLDAATTKKLQDIAYQAQASQTRAQAEVKVQRMELRRLLDLDKPDEKEVMRQLDAVNKLELDLRKQKISTMLQMRNLLTPEQRAQLKSLREERMKEHRERGDGREGMGRGGRWGGREGAGHGGGRGMGAQGGQPDMDDGDDL